MSWLFVSVTFLQRLTCDAWARTRLLGVRAHETRHGSLCEKGSMVQMAQHILILSRLPTGTTNCIHKQLCSETLKLTWRYESTAYPAHHSSNVYVTYITQLVLKRVSSQHSKSWCEIMWEAGDGEVIGQSHRNNFWATQKEVGQINL